MSGPRLARWDSTDDHPMQTLLEVCAPSASIHRTSPHNLRPARWQHAGWGDPAQRRVRVLYDTLCAGAAAPSFAATCALLEELGVPRDHSPQYVRAISRSTLDDPAIAGLSFEDFLLGLVAMDPSTAHGGVWNGLRAQYIFRRFDVDADGRLSVDELAALMAEVRAPSTLATDSPSPF